MVKNKRILNCFDFLRFVFALIVIYSHSFVLLGLNNEFFSNYIKVPLSFYAVAGFFVISGYLISASWQSEPSIIRFIVKRLLRILPALIVAVLFSVFIIGPLVTGMTLKNYFLDKSIWIYIKHNIFIFNLRYSMADLFKNNPYPFAVNGSLWTLPIEIYAYLLVIIIGILKFKKIGSFSVLVILFVLLIIFQNNPNFESIVWANVLLSQLLRLSIFFMIGRLIYLFNFYKSGIVAILSIVLFVILYNSVFFAYQVFFTYSYLIIYFAYNSPIIFKKFREKFGDYSYGMYIYAFPVQQTIIYFLYPNLNFYTFFTLSVIVTLFLSVLSWKYIENVSLSYKDKLLKYL